MRYELVADCTDEEEALRSHPTVRPLFDPLLPVLQARAIMAAVRIGLFDEIGCETCSAEELAGQLSVDGEALRLLLRVLCCAGYLVGDSGRYRLAECTRTTLLADSPARLSAWIEHGYFHWRVISHLEEVLATGRGIDGHDTLGDDAEWESYQRAMLETARPAAAWVAAQVPVVAGAKRMLDLGGGHGLYGGLLCRRHPPLRSVVIDRPEAIDHARQLAWQEGIDDVVEHRAGDLRQAELGRDSCDLVFLGNVAHHLTADENQDLLGRIGSALTSGGTIAIWDFALAEADSRPDLVADGLALLFRLTSTTRCYRQHELLGWLRDAGFTDLQHHLTPMPAQLLLTGRA